MSWLELAGLLVAGFGAGLVGYSAGLASLISYPALLAVGLPPLAANVSNSVALTGSTIGGLLTSGPELRPQLARVIRFSCASALGGIAGAVLLLRAPAGTFEQIVPWLVAFASVVLLARPLLRRLRAERIGEQHPGLLVLVMVICIYGGYFGAAAGVLLLATFGAVLSDEYASFNALKAVVLGSANIAASVIFIIAGPVQLAAVIPLAIGCLIGSAVGPPIVRRLPETPLRIAVGIAGLILAIKLFLD